MRKIDNMNDTTDVNEEKRESPFYSFFDADLVFDIIKIVILILMLVSGLFGISKCFKLLGEKSKLQLQSEHFSRNYYG